MTDKELARKIVKDQISAIRLQRQYKHNPLAIPPLLDAEWAEAIKRGLHIQINKDVKNHIELYDNLR